VTLVREVVSESDVEVLESVVLLLELLDPVEVVEDVAVVKVVEAESVLVESVVDGQPARPTLQHQSFFAVDHPSAQFS